MGVADPGTRVYPIACHIAAMSQLVQTFPEVFVESAEIQEREESGFCATGMSSEDLQRAFWMLKFHLRHKSSAKQKKGFYDSAETGMVPPPRYYTDDDVKRCQERQTTGAAGDETDAVHPVEAYLAEEREEPIEIDDPEPDDRMFDQKMQDTDKAVDLIADLAGQSTREVDTRRVGRLWERAPLNLDAKRSLCREMGRRVKVLHGSKFVQVDSDDATVQVGPQTLVCRWTSTDMISSRA